MEHLTPTSDLQCPNTTTKNMTASEAKQLIYSGRISKDQYLEIIPAIIEIENTDSELGNQLRNELEYVKII